MTTKSCKYNLITIALCFIISVTLAVLIFAKLQIYPGGKFTILTFDLAAQHLPFITSLRYIGNKDCSVLFSMLGGLGVNNLAQFSYYMISPFYLLTTFIPLESLPDAIYFITIIRLGLCSVSFCTYVLYGLRHHNDRCIVILLSTAYALSSYNIFYSMCVNFFDVIILLPILLIGIEKILRGERGTLYITVLTLSLYCNYYIAYMAGLFLCMYLVYRLMVFEKSFRECIRSVLSFSIMSVLSLGLSMPLLLPTLRYMAMGKITEKAETVESIIRVTPLRIIRNLFPCGEFFALDGGAPQLYCSIITIVLIMLFFISNNITRNRKVAALVIFSIYFLSFMITPLDRIWHGFRDPECFPARYAFTCVCFMLIIACESLDSDIFVKIRNKMTKTKTVYAFISVFVFLGLYFNGTTALMDANNTSSYIQYDKYKMDIHAINAVLNDVDDSTLYRTISTNSVSALDSFLFGYNGVEMFSSAYNGTLHDYLKRMGLRCVDQTLRTTGITPPVESILGVKYLIGTKSSSYGFEYYSGNNPYVLYRNPYALPIGYMAYPSAGSHAVDGNPFVAQEQLISGLLGRKTSLYIPNDISVIGKEGKEYARSSAIDCMIKQDGPVYVFFPPGSCKEKDEFDIDTRATVYNRLTVRREESILTVNGKDRYDFIEKKSSKCVYIGDYKRGDVLSLIVYSTTYYKDPLIMTLNTGAYISAMEEMAAHPLNITSHRNGIIEGTVTGIPGKTLILSIPYMDGYRIFIDGQKTAYACYNPAMISIDIPNGVHNIRISYLPPGLNAGCTIGMLSTVLLILYILKQKHTIAKQRTHA